MKITAHDENSLTILLFSEIHRLGKAADLLHAIRWRSHPRLPFGIKEVELHLQLGLSEFGKPDAVFVVTDLLDLLHLVIVEGKLGAYRDACEEPLSGRLFDNSCNSMLNNQLALRYRAMRAIGSLTTGAFLKEQPHSSASPYEKDKPRSCQKGSTLQLLRQAIPRLVDFSLVALTLDSDPPLVTLPATDPCFPLFFRQDTQSPDDDFPLLGGLSWHACAAIFSGIENHFTPAFQNLLRQGGANDEVGEEDDRFLIGRHIVLYQGQPCLFSGKGYSFKLHKWEDNDFKTIKESKKNRENYEAISADIRLIQAAPDENMKNKVFWSDFFRNLQVSAEETPLG